MPPKPESSAYPLGPAMEFLEPIWALNHALERLSGTMTLRVGVTVQQGIILRCLARYPGLPAGQLAELLHVDPGTVSAALRRLEHKGLVSRRRDPKDRRRSALGLTRKGRELSRVAARPAESAVERLLEHTASSDLDATRRVLMQFTSYVIEGAGSTR